MEPFQIVLGLIVLMAVLLIIRTARNNGEEESTEGLVEAEDELVESGLEDTTVIGPRRTHKKKK